MRAVFFSGNTAPSFDRDAGNARIHDGTTEPRVGGEVGCSHPLVETSE
jgi:hypothetical protein